MKNNTQKNVETLGRGTGLVKLPPNPGKRADISHAVVFGVLGAAQIPKTDFDVAEPLKIKNQYATDFCTGFASSEVTEDQEGVEIDPLFQFAAIKRQAGEYKTWGSDLRTAGLALVNFGSLPQSMAPYKLNTGKTRDFLANWKNYAEELWTAAKSHKKQTMFFVDGPYDLFTNIIMTLWQNKDERRSVLLGTFWRDSWNDAPGGVIPEWTPYDPAHDNGGGHCIKGFGQKMIGGKPYLKIQNSWGEDVGNNGIYYFPASVVNKEFQDFGQITFKDMDPEEAHYYQENGISVNDNWIVQLLKAFSAALSDLIKKLTPQ